jgi:hypothetical protein
MWITLWGFQATSSPVNGIASFWFYSEVLFRELLCRDGVFAVLVLAIMGLAEIWYRVKETPG